MLDLSVRTQSRDGRGVVTVVGEVDVYTAPRLRERMFDLISEGEHDLIIDLTGVEFLDSTGLGVLIHGRNRLSEHHGSLALVCAQERILKVFRITGLIGLFPFYTDLEAAMTAPSHPVDRTD